MKGRLAIITIITILCCRPLYASKVWDTYTSIQGGSISSPVNYGVYLCGAVVEFLCSRGNDTDHWYDANTCEDGYPEDGMSASYPQWSASAGSFLDGDYIGQLVYWIAPNSDTANITVTMYENDLPNSVPPGDTGTRDDSESQRDQKTGIQAISPILYTVTYGGGNHAIYDVTTPEYTAGPVKNEPAVWTAGSDATATATFWYSTSLSQGAANVTVRAETSGDGYNIGDWGNSAYNFFGPSWPTDNVYLVSEATIDNEVQYQDYSAQWKYKCPFGSNTWINITNQTGCRLYVVYGAPTCGDTHYTKANILGAVNKASGKSSESGIASEANENVSHSLYEGCICYGLDNLGFQTNFDAAMGTYPPSPPRGMCCCRATGLNCVLQVLGIEPYTLVFCNEKPESSWGTSNHWCGGICSVHGNVERRYASGLYIWEGAIRSGGTGTTCYAPGTNDPDTEFKGTYDEIANNTYKWYRWVPPTGPWAACSSGCSVTGDSQYGCDSHSSWWGRFD